MKVTVSLPLRIVELLQSGLVWVWGNILKPSLRWVLNKLGISEDGCKERAVTLSVSVGVHLLLLLLISSAIVVSSNPGKTAFIAPDSGLLDSVAEGSDSDSPAEDSLASLDSEPTLPESLPLDTTHETVDLNLTSDLVMSESARITSNSSLAHSPSLKSGVLKSGLSEGTSPQTRGHKGGALFGLNLQTTNQGVIIVLDTSGSMEPLAEKVRATVEENFPEARIITVKGALFATEKTLVKMRKERGAADFYVGYYTSMLEYSLIAQIKKMLLSYPTIPESIYFFSDYADYVDPLAVKEFSELMMEKKIKFFAHSVGKDPDPSITRLCKVTGGQELIEKVVSN